MSVSERLKERLLSLIGERRETDEMVSLLESDGGGGGGGGGATFKKFYAKITNVQPLIVTEYSPTPLTWDVTVADDNAAFNGTDTYIVAETSFMNLALNLRASDSTQGRTFAVVINGTPVASCADNEGTSAAIPSGKDRTFGLSMVDYPVTAGDMIQIMYGLNDAAANVYPNILSSSGDACYWQMSFRTAGTGGGGNGGGSVVIERFHAKRTSLTTVSVNTVIVCDTVVEQTEMGEIVALPGPNAFGSYNTTTGIFTFAKSGVIVGASQIVRWVNPPVQSPLESYLKTSGPSGSRKYAMDMITNNDGWVQANAFLGTTASVNGVRMEIGDEIHLEGNLIYSGILGSPTASVYGDADGNTNFTFTFIPD